MIREDMIDKVEFYLNSGKKIHISIGNGIFYNGKIISVNKEKGTLVLQDSKIGGVFILFDEIIRIEPFREIDNEINKGIGGRDGEMDDDKIGGSDKMFGSNKIRGDF